ncbi:uncharacterized protein RCO7_03886 [Rhynchosporium graminicola]|uniref:Clr5 domain-containing protein n=1 Tax=Rhynchosporium graminicola TaxID=2792576 RepID=A0A1E1LLK4_9HELO|nr:uncharacterized protein RCO7_03886 [Rhynchosporium commune]
MPKDWKYHKAEVERLYTQEGKPLQEVRDILREEHGFNASLRAYQLRIDTWGLSQKNSLIRKPLRVSSEPPAKPDTIQLTSTIHRESPGSGQDLVPARQVEPLRDGRSSFDVVCAFETLLSRWQPKRESTLLCFQHPDFSEWVENSNSNHGPILFKLIEALVPKEEQFMLNKAFLEADLLSHSDPDYPFPAWRYAWKMVLRCDDSEEENYECGTDYCSKDWERAKELLEEDEFISQVAGQAFLDCALVVLAERRLTICKMDPHHSNRRKYLYILKDFRYSGVDVDPIFYKHSLQMIEVDDHKTSHESLRKRAELADEYRHRYLQLINRYALLKKRISHVASVTANGIGPLRRNSSDSTDGNQVSLSEIVAAEQYPSPDTAITASMSNGLPSSPEGGVTVSDSTMPTTREVFDLLFNKWKTLNDFTEYAHSVITSDGWTISIFEPCPVGGDNLFDIIDTEVPEPERVPFITALLVAFSSVNITPLYSPWFIHWWTSVYASPNWDRFLLRLDLPRTKSQLERIMSPEAAKTFVDSAFLLVGERILLGIKTKLVAARRREMNEAQQDTFQKLHKQYTGILREFHARGMKVDQTWTYYLMNIL